MSFLTDPLDRLLDQALKEANQRKVKSSPDKPSKREAGYQPFTSTYTNPENWTKGRGIALIHKAESGVLTLLGNFVEYTHIRQKGVRRLQREESPMTIESQEIVTGSWWLDQEVKRRISPSEEVQDIELTLRVILKGIGYAEHVQINVRVFQGAMFRIELVEQTKFVNPEHNTLTFFPAGLDIMEGMTMENKIEVRKLLEGVL